MRLLSVFKHFNPSVSRCEELKVICVQPAVDNKEVNRYHNSVANRVGNIFQILASKFLEYKYLMEGCKHCFNGCVA